MPDYAAEIDAEYPEDLKFQYGKEIKNTPSLERTPFISYDYLIIDADHPYNFAHSEFKKEEYEKYFLRIKKICKTKHCNMGSEMKDCNFQINDRTSNKMYVMLKTVFNVSTIIPEERTPPVGHFHIFSKDERPEDGKCPVIHFFVGPLNTFYILCYDPHHDIHERNNR